MRILLYSFEYPPLGGGVGRSLKALLNHFTDYSDLRIDVVTSSVNGRFHKRKLSPQITLYFLPGPNREKSLHGQKPIHMLYFTVIAWLYSWKLLFTNHYNGTHFYGFPGGVISWLFSWKVPYLLSLRGVEVPYYNPQYNRWYYWYRPLARLIWRKAKGISVNSTNLRTLAQATESSLDYTLIPNGVDTTFFKPVPEHKKLKLFTITAGATILSSIKNLDTLVQAFCRFHKNHPDSRLVLIGSGPEEGRLKQRAETLGISGAVRFVGRKNHEWLKVHLPRYHVVCLPSLNEGMSNALLEALACGLPVVISKAAGRELVDGNGFIVDSNSISETTAALEKLYANPSERVAMGKKSRELALTLSWQRAAQQYVKWYQQSIEKK